MKTEGKSVLHNLLEEYDEYCILAYSSERPAIEYSVYVKVAKQNENKDREAVWEGDVGEGPKRSINLYERVQRCAAQQNRRDDADWELDS